MLSSKFRPRVIPMLYSFYLIVYSICISYYYYYIFLLYIPLFNYLLFPFLCVCRLYIGFLLSLIFFILCLWFGGIYDNIKDIDDFYFLCVVCDHWLYDYLFSFFMCCLGLWVYNPCDRDDYLYHRTGIYLFDFFFVCVFLGWVYIIILEV